MIILVDNLKGVHDYCLVDLLGMALLHIFFCGLENDMDGEALRTLFGHTSGPDSLKDLVPKLGLRLRLFKEMIDLYNSSSDSSSNSAVS